MIYRKEPQPVKSHYLMAFMITALISLFLSKAVSAAEAPLPLNLFPDKDTGAFTVNEEESAQGTHSLRINLKGRSKTYSLLTPLDADQKPSCSLLEERMRTQLQILSVGSSHIETICQPSTGSGVNIEIFLERQNDNWIMNQITWQLGPQKITGHILSETVINNRSANYLLGIQNRLLEESEQLGKEWPGLNVSQTSLPGASWNWVAGSKHTAHDTATSAWHIYEIINHFMEGTECATKKDIVGATLNYLALPIHILDALSHLHHLVLGKYIYLDYYSDLLKYTNHPKAANTGFASTSLLLNLVEMYRDYGSPHHHHGGSGLLGLISEHHNVISTVHHSMELWEAMNDWVFDDDDDPQHNHSHSH